MRSYFADLLIVAVSDHGNAVISDHMLALDFLFSAKLKPTPYGRGHVSWLCFLLSRVLPSDQRGRETRSGVPS